MVLSIVSVTFTFTQLSLAQPEEERHLIVISIDGCRWDYLQDENLINIRQMIEEGAVANHMVITNPSMTGPGHITLLTGAWTGKHGIMLNQFYDRQLGFINFFGEIPPEEQVNYLQAEPLWVPAEDAGLNTAAVHWTSTAGEYEGRRVDTVVPFSSMPDHDRIEHAIQIINDNKPNLLLVYTGGVHSESYNYGPGSDEVKNKLRIIDGWIGEIFDAVKEAGLWNSTDFIITSDHGFTEGYSRQICPSYVLANIGIGYEFVLWGAFGHIFLSNPDQAENAKTLFVGMEGVDEVYTKAEIENLNLYNLYNENRCGDVVIVSKYGYQVAGSTWGPYENAVENVQEDRYRAGSHGYPGDLQDMWGIFLAYGAHIRRANLGEVRQVDVAPTIAAIAGFPPPEDADGEALNVVKTIFTSILPSESEGLPGEDVIFLVTVKNTGSTAENYLLENVDNSGWALELENNVIEVPAGENRTTTLAVTIPENAEPGTEDLITITATSIENENVSDNDSCIAHVIPPKAELSLVALYKVGLDLDLYFDNGSKLVVKFYTYDDAFENENVIETFTPPWHVEENKSARHPEGIGVKKARLVLTYEDTENVISTIASFTVARDDIFGRVMEIKGRWPIASPDERNALFQEIMDIKGQWPFAPS